MKKKLAWIAGVFVLSLTAIAIIVFTSLHQDNVIVSPYSLEPQDLGSGVVVTPEVPEPIDLAEGVPEEFKNSSPQEKKAVIDQAIERIPRFNKMQQIAEARNNPVDFYAKLIDQHDEPITGAVVRYQVGLAQLLGGWGNQPGEALTDADGMFRITGLNGENYKVNSIDKAGYVFNKSVNTLLTTTGRMGLPVPETSSDDPWIYRGWRIEEVAQVKSVRIGGKIIPDGRSYTITFPDDLPNQMEFEEGNDGDITITIERDVNINDENWFFSEFNNWSVTINVARGGLIEIPDQEGDGYLYTAPESGYASNLTLKASNDQPNWQRKYKKNYYLLLNGLYGRTRFYVNPFFREAYADITFRAILNTEGSRNLLSQEDM